MNGLSRMIIDTDILSLYLRNNPKVVGEAQKYLRQYGVFSFSVITRFEILRGMKARTASTRLDFFELFCQQNEVVELHDSVIIRASDIYANLYRRGELIGDADILIAATALERGIPVVTNNELHFNRISDLEVINWTR